MASHLPPEQHVLSYHLSSHGTRLFLNPSSSDPHSSSPAPPSSVHYSISIPWYLTRDYRERHQLTLKDLRDMLSSTPVAILLQLCISVGLDVDAMLTPEILTDHTWGSIEEWKAGLDAAPISLSEGLFKDDCRLLTALVNALYKYLEFESKQQPWIGGETGGGGSQGSNNSGNRQSSSSGPKPQPKCTCPFDTHVPALPVHTDEGFRGLLEESKVGDVVALFGGSCDGTHEDPNGVFNSSPNDAPGFSSGFPSAEPPMLWKCLGAFHGYQRWQRVDQGHELVLLQTPGGHQALQQWEAANKKRKEMFVERWGEEMFKG